MVLLAAGSVTDVAQTAEDAVKDVNRFTEYIQEHIPVLINFGIKVVFAILFFCIGRVLIKWVRKLVRHSFERSSADKGVAQFVDSVLKFGLYALLLFTIATKFGVDTASAAALIASGGVAIGLALQGSLSNAPGGEVTDAIGTGIFHQHARNSLEAGVITLAHNGSWKHNANTLRWGVSGQAELISDHISEWEWRDSAGYSLPNDGQTMELYYAMRGDSSMKSAREWKKSGK